MEIKNFNKVKEIVDIIQKKEKLLENLFRNKKRADLELYLDDGRFFYELTAPCFNYIQNQLKMQLEKEIKEYIEELEKL
jgi:hypothetical protein